MKDFDWIDVADLKPWLKNPRWNDQAVVPVANSIEEFGFGAPIVVQSWFKYDHCRPYEIEGGDQTWLEEGTV